MLKFRIMEWAMNNSNFVGPTFISTIIFKRIAGKILWCEMKNDILVQIRSFF